LQTFYSVRSERQLMERIEFDLRFRWFVGLGFDARCGTIRASRQTATGCWTAKSPPNFLAAVLSQPRVKRLLSSQHFSVDGTLIEAWVSPMSFKPKQPPGNDDGRSGARNTPADFRGQKRSKETHRSTTDPDARLYRKGPGMEAKHCFIGHGLMENRSAKSWAARQRMSWISGLVRHVGDLSSAHHLLSIAFSGMHSPSENPPG
jgi:hypothetical protein